jgi:hypothetical protein
MSQRYVVTHVPSELGQYPRPATGRNRPLAKSNPATEAGSRAAGGQSDQFRRAAQSCRGLPTSSPSESRGGISSTRWRKLSFPAPMGLSFLCLMAHFLRHTLRSYLIGNM